MASPPGPSRLTSFTIRSNRGVKLLYDEGGYEYRKYHVTREGQQLWRCNTRRCRGKAKEEGGSVVVYEPRHLPPDHRDEIRMVTKSAKAQRQNGAPVALVISRHVLQAPDHLKPLLNASSVRRTVQRASNIAGLREWPAPIDESLFDEAFLRYDSCVSYQEGDSRALKIFATEHGMNLMRVNLDWCVDGTFHVAPYGFSQVLVVGVKDCHIFTPCLYAFLSDKSAVAYTKVYEWMNNAGIPQPLTVQQDFEPALTMAIHAVYPRVSIQYCVFHFYNSIYRHIQKYSLVRIYRDNVTKWCLKGCMALAFIDPANVCGYFDTLSEEGLASVPAASYINLSRQLIVEFYMYFERTYLGKLVNGARSQPIFGIDRWNMYSSILNNEQIGNSAQEGYNSRLKVVPASSSAQFVSIKLPCHQKDYEAKHTSAVLENLTVVQLHPQSLRVAALHRRRNMAIANDRRAGHTTIDHLRALSSYIKVTV